MAKLSRGGLYCPSWVRGTRIRTSKPDVPSSELRSRVRAPPQTWPRSNEEKIFLCPAVFIPFIRLFVIRLCCARPCVEGVGIEQRIHTTRAELAEPSEQINNTTDTGKGQGGQGRQGNQED